MMTKLACSWIFLLWAARSDAFSSRLGGSTSSSVLSWLSQTRHPMPGVSSSGLVARTAHPAKEQLIDRGDLKESVWSSVDERPKAGPPTSPRSWLGQALATAAVMTAVSWYLPTADLFLPLESTSTTRTTSSITAARSSSFSVGWTGMDRSAWMASAKEMASGTGSRVNKDPESLLRYGLPIKNKEVRTLQVSLEDIKLDIASKRILSAMDDVKKAKRILSGKEAEAMKAACREPSVCASLMQSMDQDLSPLSVALKEASDSFQGSEQERVAYDRAYAAQKKVINTLNKLEEQMIPAGYQTPVPSQYLDLPLLRGRATVEMVFRKADQSTYDVLGNTYPEAKMVMVIDGYTAPVTSGNFIDLVSKGFYNKMAIQRSDGFVVQTGDPDGEAIGYVGPGSASVGQGSKGERLIPLEIFIRGDAGPIYESTIEDEGRGGQATVLPFSSYGAMGWARDEYEPNSGSSQFFWLLFESDLTPAGKNVLDGRYPCFGYVVEGAEFLSDMDEGDIIVSAKVTQGTENLVQPR